MLFREHGAPSAAMTVGRRKDRATDELIGICRGILADGMTAVDEAVFLKRWIERNSEFARSEPFRTILERLTDALEDGVLDSDEERDLLDLLLSIIGGEADGRSGIVSQSTTLPLCNPAPDIAFPNSVFVVTGTFSYGPRSQVHGTIESLGGKCSSAISGKVRYLVIGELGSRDWIHSSFGRKIEQAVELRDAGNPLSIVNEQHWSRFL